MSSIIQTIQNRSFTLPTTTDTSNKSLRRRLSSLSLNLHPISSPSTSWSSFRTSKSVSDATAFIRYWWQWILNWVMSRKPSFTQDLEMNEYEISTLGSHHRGTVKHLFFKIRSEVRKLVGSGRDVGLPQTYRYDSVKYSKNFHHGKISW